MEDDKRSDRNLAKAEAAQRLACIEQGVFWIGTERTLTRARHYNLVYLHARRKSFPAFDNIATALQEVWPIGDVASVEEIESRIVSCQSGPSGDLENRGGCCGKGTSAGGSGKADP